MKKIPFLFLYLFTSIFCYGQPKVIAESPEFKDPPNGKIFQLKDGTTVFIQLFKDGDKIISRIYGPDHKQHSEKVEKIKLKGAAGEGIFEHNGKINFFVSGYEDKNVPVLLRLIIDANTGKIEREEKIGSLMKASGEREYATIYGNVPRPRFYVKKDEKSNNYAVLLMNSFEPDLHKRIEVIFYNADNKEIARSYYRSPRQQYKFMRYIDMTVIGDEKVEILARASTTDKIKGKDLEEELVLAELTKSGIILTELSAIDMSSGETNFYVGMLTYNPASNKLIMVTSRENDNDKRHTYINTLVTFDIAGKKIDKTAELTLDRVNEKNIELFGRKSPYSAAPRSIYMNEDGNYSIVYETIRRKYVSSSSGAQCFYVLGNIAISNYDKNDTQISSALMPADYFLYDCYAHPFDVPADGERDRFKFAAYLRAKGKHYIFLNDIADNAEDMLKGNLTTIKSVRKCDAFYYEIRDNDLLPKRKFVFGKPARKQHYVNLPDVSAYSAETGLYATLRLNPDSKMYKLTWIQL
jgi:hypothetical protein